MRIADYEAEEVRRETCRKAGATRKYAGVIEEFLQMRPKLNNLREAQDLVDRIREAVRVMLSANEDMLR